MPRDVIMMTLVVAAMAAVVASFSFLPGSIPTFPCGRSCRWTARSRSSGQSRRLAQQRQELITCGLQVIVRIRGKRSREEDYTNQVSDMKRVEGCCLHQNLCSTILRAIVVLESYDITAMIGSASQLLVRGFRELNKCSSNLHSPAFITPTCPI